MLFGWGKNARKSIVSIRHSVYLSGYGKYLAFFAISWAQSLKWLKKLQSVVFCYLFLLVESGKKKEMHLPNDILTDAEKDLSRRDSAERAR